MAVRALDRGKDLQRPLGDDALASWPAAPAGWSIPTIWISGVSP